MLSRTGVNVAETRPVSCLKVSPKSPAQRSMEKLIGKSGFASSLIRPTEPLAADCTNQEHRPWTSRTGERTDSFSDLFDAAVPLAVSLQRAALDRYYQQKPLDPRFFPTDFTGTPIKK